MHKMAGLNKRKYFWALMCVLAGIFWAGIGSARALTEGQIFDKRLTKALSIAKTYFETDSPTLAYTRKFDEAIKDLDNFSLDYPSSEYADDAQFVAVALNFIDAIMGGKEGKAYLAMREMKDLAERYPQGKIELDTVYKSGRVVDSYIPSAFMYIPYRYMEIYMNGWAGWKFGNYETVISSYTELKDALDFFAIDPNGYLVTDIYEALADSYAKTHDEEAATAIAQEAVKRFPDNRELHRFMRKYLKKQKSNIAPSTF